MEGTSFNEFFLPSKLESNDLNDKVDVLSNPHILVKNVIQYSELCMYVCPNIKMSIKIFSQGEFQRILDMLINENLLSNDTKINFL